MAEDLQVAGRFGNDQQIVAEVFNAIDELQKVHAKSFLNLINIETVFGAIEMARIIKRLGNFSVEQIEKLHEATMSSTNIRRIVVFDPDESVSNRFQAILGAGIKPRFRYEKVYFETAVKIMGSFI